MTLNIINPLSINFLNKERKFFILSFDEAAKLASSYKRNKSFKRKNKKTILYGLTMKNNVKLFFKPIFLTDSERKSVEKEYGTHGIIYCVYQNQK